jgi:carbonic anhydrase
MQMRRLQDFSPAIRSAVQSNKLEIIGAVFDIATGNVRFL